MDARRINLTLVLGELSTDRVYLSCISDEFSKTALTLIIPGWRNSNRPDDYVKENKNYRNYKETGVHVGLFGTSVVFFAICTDDFAVLCPDSDASYRRGRGRAA